MILSLLTISSFALAVARAAYCPNGTCFTGATGCLESTADVLCAECDLTGYLNENGTCVQTVFARGARTPTLRSCSEDDECSIDGTCGVSTYGVRCDECSGRGYLVSDYACECYDDSLDPENSCSSSVGFVYEDVTVTVDRDRVYCVPHKSKILGCYADPDPFETGVDVATTPTKCCMDLYAPEPGVIVEKDGAPFVTCATYGAIDPEKPENGKVVCAGHGDWNGTACVCYEGWTEVYLGDDYFGDPASVCSDCSALVGPSPVRDADQGPPYCVGPWLPDPADGVHKQCSGHGVVSDGGDCVCRDDDDYGHWELVEVENVLTCAACATGWTGSDCTVYDGATDSPTPETPTNEPTESPTKSPLPFCEGCPEKSEGNSVYHSVHTIFFENETFVPTSVCCPNTTISVSNFGGTYLNLTVDDCTETFESRQRYGWELCRLYGKECAAFSWWEASPNDTQITYAFFSQVGLPEPVEDFVAGSALACDRTESPTKEPTKRPTPFPTTRDRNE